MTCNHADLTVNCDAPIADIKCTLDKTIRAAMNSGIQRFILIGDGAPLHTRHNLPSCHRKHIILGGGGLAFQTEIETETKTQTDR